LKQLLAEKTLEVDFFKGALQKIEARRQRNSGSGEMAGPLSAEHRVKPETAGQLRCGTMNCKLVL